MNKKLTKEEVIQTAKLAAIPLQSNEVEKFQSQLSETVNYIEILSELNTEGVQPCYQVTGLKNIFREDKTEKSLDTSEVFSAKKSFKGMFKTGAVFDQK